MVVQGTQHRRRLDRGKHVLGAAPKTHWPKGFGI